MSEDTCQTCRFYKEEQCKRHPPTPILMGTQKHALTQEVRQVINFVYPRMPADGWCGEHGPKHNNRIGELG